MSLNLFSKYGRLYDMCRTDFSNLVSIHFVISEEIKFIFQLNVASSSTHQFISVKSSNSNTILT